MGPSCEMSLLHLVPIVPRAPKPRGAVERRVLADLRADLQGAFGKDCEILPEEVDPDFAFHPGRQQYHSTEILKRLSPLGQAGSWRLLGVTEVDLYIPVLTFVFGEAQLGNSCAVISYHRLRQEFYGLPPDAGLLRDRLLKEAVHELGHTLGLRHCEDYRCAMAPSHAVEWIDVKSVGLCDHCRSRVCAPGE